MRYVLLYLMLCLTLPGCGILSPKPQRTAIFVPVVREPVPDMVPPADVAVLGAQAVPAEVLETAGAGEGVEPSSVPATSGERELGRVVAAIGPPAEPGLWLRTSLVAAPVQGRVETVSGQSLTLELRPGTGGSLLSLAAFQALGLGLADLAELAVFGP